jgi:pantoate--beta-alanine ligase
MMMSLIAQLKKSKHFTRSVHVLRTIAEMVQYRDSLAQTKKVGFVPTMGALHAGHISLVHRAKQECDITLSSIFVNSKQFSAGEDLDKYPRQLEADLQLLYEAHVDAVFIPTHQEMYPSQGALCHVEPAAFSQIMEGVARPDFFRGVATVVAKLFNLTQPTVAYFGQKDISQCVLLIKMVEDLNMRTRIQVCETLRAEDGLALSSRNVYLRPIERPAANILYRALKAGSDHFQTLSAGSMAAEEVRRHVLAVLQAQPMVSRIEYISVASHRNMQELSQVNNVEGAVLSSAIRLGQVRLIDNLLLGPAERHILYSNSLR